MATPQRNLVIERIDTVFGNISTANGYKVDVAATSREIYDWETANQEGNFPFVCFRPGRTAYSFEAGRGVRCIMDLDIIIHVRTATPAERSDELSDLEDDIWKALSDGQLNSASGGTDLAVSAKLISYETDEGDPDTMDSRGGSGTGHITAQIIYYRTADGS